MNFEDAVVVETFSDHATADAAVSLLASEGIDAFVSSDDAGGELPNLDVGGSIRVFVRSENLELARGLLHANVPG